MTFLRICFYVMLYCFSTLFAADWDCVYLASFPRSGNHWVRFLIEEATHIATSSVYKDVDYPHLPTPFPWGGYSTDHGYTGTCRYPLQNEPVVLKSHYPVFRKPIQPFKRAICLIRHPIDAFYSYHVYRQKRDDQQRIPKKVLTESIKKWREFYEYWDKLPGVIIVRYEDLYKDPCSCLAKIIQTVGYETQPEDIQRAVDRYPPNGGLLKHLHSYEKEDIELIKSEMGDLLTKYDYSL